MIKTFWISFADDQGCLGAVIIEAQNETFALAQATARGLNPGGEAAFVDITNPNGLAEADRLGRNRFMPVSELRKRGYKLVSEMSPEVQERFGKQLHVCDNCNAGIIHTHN